MMLDRKISDSQKKEDLLQKLLIIFGVGLLLISWISFIITPMTGDLKVFMASARQASYISNNWIIGSFKAWELKSVFSRGIAYLIYKIAILIVPYSTLAFEMVCKSIYSVFIILISCLSMKLIFRDNKRIVIQSSIVVSTVFMAMHTGCQMQVEMTSSLLILLAFSLYLNAIKTCKATFSKLFLAGIFIGTTFYFKSVLILLSITVVSAICIYKIKNEMRLSIKEMVVVIGGSLATILTTAILVVLINPSEFQDMIDASAFQSTLFSSDISIKSIILHFGYSHLSAIRFLPGVMLGIVCLFINGVLCIQKKVWKELFFHIVMWMMPAIFIMLSNKYFIYHFASYIFPSIIEMYFALYNTKKSGKICLAATTAGITIWYVLLFSAFSVNVQTYIVMDKQAYNDTRNFINNIEYDRSEEVLYLDDGTGGYALGNPSYLKYFFPLPLQRLPEDSNLKCHVDSLEKTMGFEGKYISVYEDWFFDGGRYQNLKEKLLSEYEYMGSYCVFSPPHSLKSSDAHTRTIDLYQRKDTLEQ